MRGIGMGAIGRSGPGPSRFGRWRFSVQIRLRYGTSVSGRLSMLGGRLRLLRGQADAHFAVSVPALPFLRSGQLKGLAVGTLKRAELLPDLPTLDEAGVKGYDAANWYAIAAPSGTPRAIVMKLHNEIARFFTSPKMQKQMTAMGAVIDLKTPDEMRKIIPAEIDKWTKVAIDAGMPRADK